MEAEVKILIEELNRRLRHGTIEYTKMWCRDNRVEIHEGSGGEFIYKFQLESAITKIKFLKHIKFYKETWEQEWKIAMKEYMKGEIESMIIVLN